MPDGVAEIHPDDGTLLAELRGGNGVAAARVMQRHNRRLWRIARGILGDDGEAEEAVQDTWLRAFAGAHAYRGDASLGTWLARIVINEALRRADRRRPTVELDPIADLRWTILVRPPWRRRQGPSMQPLTPKSAAWWNSKSILCHRRSVWCS